MIHNPAELLPNGTRRWQGIARKRTNKYGENVTTHGLRMTGSHLVVGVVLALALFGCGGSAPPPIAQVTGTFYNFDDVGSGSSAKALEEPYPALNLKPDLKDRRGSPEYIGVSVLGGSVHLSRPKNWQIRRASLVPEHRFIEYISPNEYIFAIYERNDSPSDPWLDVLERYEEDAKKEGAEIVGQRVPVATWNAQGREYVIKRKIKAQKSPFTNFSREVLLRNDHRIDLVQIVYQGETLKPVGDDLLRVMEMLALY